MNLGQTDTSEFESRIFQRGQGAENVGPNRETVNLGQAAESHFLRVRIPEFYRFQREKAATELSLSRLFCRRVVCAGAAGPFSNNPLSPNRRRPPATDASRTGTPGRRHESSNPGFQLPDDASSNPILAGEKFESDSGGAQSKKKDLAPACSRRPPPRAPLARRLSFGQEKGTPHTVRWSGRGGDCNPAPR